MTPPHATRVRRPISPEQYRRITVVALVSLAAIIVTGAAVRLTGSGLGCTDWPTCEQNQFHPPLEFHAMVEFVNRLITGLVSAAVIAAVLGSVRRSPRRRDLTAWSWVLVAGVVAQIIIGAIVVFSELAYSTVALHFLVSMLLVWAAMVLWDRAGRSDDDRRPRRWDASTRALVALSTLVLVSGSVVTSTGPHSGDDEATKRLPLDLGQTARAHSVLVWFTCAAVVWIVIRLHRHPASDERSSRQRRAARELLFAVVAQGAVGYAQYFNGVPELLVGVHVAGATLVWILALRLAFALARPVGELSEGPAVPSRLETSHAGAPST